MIVKKIKEWWNKPIIYHVENHTSGGLIVEGHTPAHDVETTRGKEICEIARCLFVLLFAIVVGGLMYTIW